MADEVAAAAVADAGRLADNADEAALSLSRMDELMGERRVFSEAETRAAFSGGSDGALSNRLNQCGNSFTAGTPIETEAGQKPIEEIKVGDKVLAEDPETGEQGYFEVVALTNHPTDEVLKVTVEAEAKATLKGAGAQAEAEKETNTLDSTADSGDNDQAQLNSGADDEHRPTFQPSNLPTLQLTPDHPVYVEGKGWLWAENLAVGDRLRRSDGGMAKVLAVERIKLAEPEPVYNFTVKGPHTYFVLEVGVLVHNVVCIDGLEENDVAYLIGGFPQSDRAAKQIIDLSKQYDQVIVNDILFDDDAVLELALKNALENYGYRLPDNVKVTSVNAANLRISKADVFVVAPNAGLHGALAKTAKNLGKNSRLIVASNLDDSAERLAKSLNEQNSELIMDYRKRGPIEVTIGKRKILLDSDYLDDAGPDKRNPLIWMIN